MLKSAESRKVAQNLGLGPIRNLRSLSDLSFFPHIFASGGRVDGENYSLRPASIVKLLDGPYNPNLTKFCRVQPSRSPQVVTQPVHSPASDPAARHLPFPCHNNQAEIGTAAGPLSWPIIRQCSGPTRVSPYCLCRVRITLARPAVCMACSAIPRTQR